MDVKVSKGNNISRRFIERNSSMLDEIPSKTVHKDEEVISRGKGSKNLNKLKPVKNSNKNLLRISPMQKEVPPSYKLQGHSYE